MTTKPQIEPSGFFAIRTPLRPFDTLTRWAQGLTGTGALASGGDLEAALAADRALLVERLREQVRDPAVREALFVASPSLDEAIDAWLANLPGGSGGADRGSPGEKSDRGHGVLDVLVRYTSRMAARPTPFGLFSGCSVGAIGPGTRLEIAPLGKYRRHTRLDVHYLSALCEGLGRDEGIRARLRYVPSNGLHETPVQLRYAEAHVDPKTRARSYSLVSVERSGHLDAALARARQGRGATRDEIARAIVEHDPEVTLEEAAGFVESLIDGQIITSDLSPVVTGPEPIDDLVATLRSLESPAIEPLATAGAAIRALDEGGVGRPSSAYRAIAEHVAPLPAEAELARLFQVDLYKPLAGATLGKSVVREITKTIELLSRITPREETEALRKFRESFRSRYEGREVSLLEALDEETGIGFTSGLATSSEPSPLLEGLVFPGDPSPPRVPFGPRERLFQQRIADAAHRGSIAWELDDKDLEALTAKEPSPIPDTFAVMAVLAARSGEAADRGELSLHWHGLTSASGAQLLGRFCHGDAELRAHVERHLRAEESKQPEAVFAEIVHLPEGRMGNILCRPVLRPYEIAFLGRSGAPEDRRIHASDLFVSLQGDRIVLRSARLGREVVPRMSTAHNTAIAALGMYRFLCALHWQDATGLGWSWGALADAPFLPRVTHGRTVLSPARWHLPGVELKGAEKLGTAERFRRVQALRAKHRWPRWIAVADGDNVLPLDLDNVLHVDTLATMAKGRGVVPLVEVAPGEEELPVHGPEGRYVHELVVPFVRADKPPVPARVAPPAATTAAVPAVARRLAPGGDWLYAKLYTGTATADAVLREIVAPLVTETREAGVSDKWFFIRYGDPDWHVRVRFRGEPGPLYGEVLPRLHALVAPWLADGRVWKMQLDTYEREIERYGGDAGIELCESLFMADSDAILSIVQQLEPGEGNDARWRLALRGIHLLLADLGLDLATRARLMRGMRESYAREHHGDTQLDVALGARFRAERAALEELLKAPVGGEHPLDPGFVALAERSEKLRPIAAELQAREANGTLAGRVAELAGSFVHMHANRLLRSEQRTQELVLCDFLARLYESELARAKKKATA